MIFITSDPIQGRIGPIAKEDVTASWQLAHFNFPITRWRPPVVKPQGPASFNLEIEQVPRVDSRLAPMVA